MVTKAQALEIIRLCSEGVTHARQAVLLDLPHVRVSQAVEKIRAEGIPIANPKDVRYAQREAERKKHAPVVAKLLAQRAEEKALKRAQLALITGSEPPEDETSRERHARIAEHYRLGASVKALASAEGVSAPRIYAMLRAHRTWAEREREATLRSITKTKAQLAAEAARLAKRKDRNSRRDAAVRSKLGL